MIIANLDIDFDVDIEGDDSGAILTYWRAAEKRVPSSAAMAREIFAIPASGVGVERLFSEARDICTYGRHRLKADAFKWQMILSSVGRTRF